jgi:hypothetical protein
VLSFSLCNRSHIRYPVQVLRGQGGDEAESLVPDPFFQTGAEKKEEGKEHPQITVRPQTNQIDQIN